MRREQARPRRQRDGGGDLLGDAAAVEGLRAEKGDLGEGLGKNRLAQKLAFGARSCAG